MMPRPLAALLLLFVAFSSTAQQPAIGMIEVFGERRVEETTLRSALALHEGDPLPPDKEEVERRVASVPGVRAAHLEGVCCDKGKFILWLGIEERESPAIRFRAAPQGSIRLASGIVHLGQELDSAIGAAVENGRAENYIVGGRSFIRDPAARVIQEQFVPYAATHLALLRNVLRNSSDAEHRALAAQVIAYAPSLRSIIPDLARAMRDPSPHVRNDAIRALLIIATWSQQHRDLRLHIPADPFVALLDSSNWTDRNKSSNTLMQLTASREPALLQRLKERSLRSLTEMAHWTEDGYATAALFLLGRIGGMTDAVIAQAIRSGEREAIIDSARR